jgi:adenylosuccinate lyase
MIERYTRPEMAALWSEDARYARWLEVELAVCDVLAERGEIPAEAAAAIRKRACFDAERIREIERDVRHDVIAFLSDVGERIGAEARFLHLGMTSSDVLDTALALQLREAGRLLLRDADRLIEVLRRRALEHKHTPMIGRTHGVHAEPTSFGLKLLVFYEEVRRGRERLERALEAVSVGKISGAVGTFAHLEPAVEEAVCARLGVGYEPAATQIVQRDRHAEFVCALAVLASTLEKMAVEFRHLARTEVREVDEAFGSRQKGSSAMPHKRNPWRFETVSGLVRVVRGYALAALENNALWHERDISNSSVERVVLPDATCLLDFMLDRTADLVADLVVHKDRMRHNLEQTRGLPFSGALLVELMRSGLARDEAYRLVQLNARATWERGGDFKKRVLKDPAISERLPSEAIDRCFDLDAALRHVDAIFERTLGPERS